MSDKQKNVCSAPINEVISLGVGPSGGSVRGPETGRVRPNVFFSEANLAIEAVGGVGGRLGSALGRGLDSPFFDAGDSGTGGVAFFFAEPNERRKDHSDSNWTPSNSFGSGE